MDRTRIRWRNVGRLVAGLAGAAALIAVVPGLVEPDDPPALPPDVGLETGATGAYAFATTPKTGRHSHEGERHRAQPKRRRPDRPHAEPTDDAHEPARRHDTSSPAPAPPPQGPAPQPTSAPPPVPAPPPTPAPAPPPTPPAPAPSPAPHDHASAEYGASPARAQTPSAPSQFGFEH
jgi:outer membrane biosynthesis protein TonB